MDHKHSTMKRVSENSPGKTGMTDTSTNQKKTTYKINALEVSENHNLIAFNLGDKKWCSEFRKSSRRYWLVGQTNAFCENGK